MFETSLIGLNEGAARRLRTWIALGSVATQLAVMTSLTLVPLLSEAKMPIFRSTGLKTVSLLIERPKPVVVKPVASRTTEAPVATASPSAASTTRSQMILRSAAGPVSDDPPLLPPGSLMGGAALATDLGPKIGNGAKPVVVTSGVPEEQKAPLSVSSGVTAGLLLQPIRPVYPRIAVLGRVHGTVVVAATIGKNGSIIGLQVISGPEMLRQAAADAVREAHYRPYLLNGQATEVITTISVNFTMGP